MNPFLILIRVFIACGFFLYEAFLTAVVLLFSPLILGVVILWTVGDLLGRLFEGAMDNNTKRLNDNWQSSEPPPRFSVPRWAATRERPLRSTVSVGGGRSPLSLAAHDAAGRNGN